MKFTYKVLFSDVDFARVIFHGKIFEIVQEFEEKLLNAYGIYYRELIEQYDFDLAVVESGCRYLAPVTLDDVLTVEVGVRDLTEKGFLFVFNFYKEEGISISGYIRHRFIQFSKFKGTSLLKELEENFRKMEQENGNVELHLTRTTGEREKR